MPQLPPGVVRGTACLSLLGAVLTASANPPIDWAIGPDGRPLERQTVTVDLPPRPLRIAILPDRTTGRAWGLPYLRAAVIDLDRLRPDVVFTIGDMVQGYTRSVARWNEEVAEWKAIVEPLDPAPFPVAGNHDVVSGSRDPADDTFETLYREAFGPLRYAVDLPGATVVVGFSDGRRAQEGVAFSEEDLAWLDATLADAATRGEPIILLIHRPMWRSASARWSELVHPMLVRHGVDAVIAGHFHALQRDPDRDGVQYHILSACGGMIDQHPLTGQLQHLSFVHALADGSVEVHHQLVGATLGPNQVSAEDQDRAFRMKRDAEVASILGAIEEPLTGPAEGVLGLELFNPLDVPATFAWMPLREPPGVELVPPASDGGLSWNSRTSIDSFNPFTMRTDSPLLVATGGPIELAPGERRRVDLRWSIDATPTAPLPPTEVRIRATYADPRGRSVPITLIRRVPVQRVVSPSGEPAASGWRAAPHPLPISAWDFSPYDTLEPDAEARLAFDDRGDLRVTIEAPDGLVAAAVEDVRLDRTRLADPMVDAILIELGEEPACRRWLVELDPDGREEVFEAVGDRVVVVPPEQDDRPFIDWDRIPGGWRAEIRVPRTCFPSPSAARLPLQIGVADNDDTYHTQWRWIAPRRAPLQLQVP